MWDRGRRQPSTEWMFSDKLYVCLELIIIKKQKNEKNEKLQPSCEVEFTNTELVNDRIRISYRTFWPISNSSYFPFCWFPASSQGWWQEKNRKAHMKNNDKYNNNNKSGFRKDTELKEAKPNVNTVHVSWLQFNVILNGKTSNTSSLGSGPRHTSNNLGHAVLSDTEIARSLFLGNAE